MALLFHYLYILVNLTLFDFFLWRTVFILDGFRPADNLYTVDTVESTVFRIKTYQRRTLGIRWRLRSGDRRDLPINVLSFIFTEGGALGRLLWRAIVAEKHCRETSQPSHTTHNCPYRPWEIWWRICDINLPLVWCYPQPSTCVVLPPWRSFPPLGYDSYSDGTPPTLGICRRPTISLPTPKAWLFLSAVGGPEPGTPRVLGERRGTSRSPWRFVLPNPRRHSPLLQHRPLPPPALWDVYIPSGNLFPCPASGPFHRTPWFLDRTPEIFGPSTSPPHLHGVPFSSTPWGPSLSPGLHSPTFRPRSLNSRDLRNSKIFLHSLLRHFFRTGTLRTTGESRKPSRDLPRTRSRNGRSSVA